MSGHNPYYNVPPPKIVKKQPAPPQSIHEEQVAELRRQGGYQEPGRPGAGFGPGGAIGTLQQLHPVISVTQRGIIDTILYLDSISRNVVAASTSQYSWSIAGLNNNNQVSNIVELKIPKFFFPRIYPTTGLADPFYLRRVYMSFTNLPSTTGFKIGNTNAHFELEVRNVNSVAVEMIPTVDKLYLNTPIQTLSEITIQFYNAASFSTINLLPDVIRVVMLPPFPNSPAPPTYVYDNTPIRLAFTNATDWRAISDIDPNALPVYAGTLPIAEPPVLAVLTTPVAMWLTNVNTNVLSTNSIISRETGYMISDIGPRYNINTDPMLPLDVPQIAPYGFFTTADNLLGLRNDLLTNVVYDNLFSIDPAFGNTVGKVVTVQIRKNRIAFPLTLSSIQPVSTNGLVPTHV